VFFYLIKLLFSGFLTFKGNFVCGQNNSKYRDWAPLNKNTFRRLGLNSLGTQHTTISCKCNFGSISAAFSALTTKQNKTCNAFGLPEHLRSLSMESGDINRNFNMRKDVVYMLAVQSHQNCYHFSENHWPIVANPVSKATYYGRAWRAFWKQIFALCWTTYYSTMPITCTQTRIHRTQSLHYNKSLKRSSLRYIVTTNFPATIYHGDILFCLVRYRCNEVSLERYLGGILRRLYWYLAYFSFQCSPIHVMFCWYIGNKTQEQSAIFVDYSLHFFCTIL